MSAGIISLGDEILSGQVGDSNFPFLARQLGRLGIAVESHLVLGDSVGGLAEGIRRLCRGCELVLLTGGLGPTEDDITRECVAQVFGRPLEFQEALFDQVAARFARGHGVRNAVVFDAGAPWPLVQSCFDAVLVLDVLEHLEDEVTCLSEAHRVLRPGGVAILTVPAYPFLFSSWDRALGHKRRYSIPRIERVLADAGFKSARITHWNVLSVPAALVLRGAGRLLQKNRKRAEFPDVPRVVNALLKWWGRLECRCIGVGGFPLGLSLAVLVRKDEGAP